MAFVVTTRKDDIGFEISRYLGIKLYNNMCLRYRTKEKKFFEIFISRVNGGWDIKFLGSSIFSEKAYDGMRSIAKSIKKLNANRIRKGLPVYIPDKITHETEYSNKTLSLNNIKETTRYKSGCQPTVVNIKTIVNMDEKSAVEVKPYDYDDDLDLDERFWNMY